MLPVCSQHSPDIFWDVYKREDETVLSAGSSTGEASISGAERRESSLNTHTQLQTDADKHRNAETGTRPEEPAALA